ncbi:MAG: cell division protein FtsZ [Sulfurovum sp.]|nr:cell division protein FtsZ [Sulfurovum sp.]MCB4746286.1 cell division protein FtsZ [Sulfurovum sp.]MCB4748716.1 cell division protein FtsZ [Sulfurovum sp.]MCB4754772.1 cell division protein FtsZ [Sulfurovum sp.]MCB4766309.1 cell division protein FtsZ [Sulfurovum sp.]
MKEFEIDIVEKKYRTDGAKIKAIGVGGGGGNMIDHMIQEGVDGIDLIVANTDAQALESSLAPYKMQLGISATRGLGAGMVPEKGREAALESFEEIKSMVKGADIVFISAGLGGGTGTGAAPIIAQAAKEVGALTVSIVTSPFRFEGRKRTKLAKEGLEELKLESDSIIVIPNERLLSIVEKNLGIKESFRLVDDILAQAVGGISKVILSHGENDINLDFADVETVMSHRGLALMGTGHSRGTNAAYDAVKAAIESPLLDNVSIDGAMGVLVHFDIHPDYPIMEIGESMGIVEESVDGDASVIFGTTTNSDMEIDEVKITIIATGFEDKSSISELPPKTKTQETLLNGTNTINTINTRKVVGGYDGSQEDIIDIPTFMRKQMD